MSLNHFAQDAAADMTRYAAEYSAPGGAEGAAGDRHAARLAFAAAEFWHAWRAVHPDCSIYEENRPALALAMDTLGDAVAQVYAAQKEGRADPYGPESDQNIAKLIEARHAAARAAVALAAMEPSPIQLAASLSE